jgi:ubiquinone/menaquinone biosynthesis C-methylase UbiE
MTILVEICFAIIILLIIVVICWRLSSRHASLPCPSWLAWLVELENPVGKNHNARTIIQRLKVREGMRVLDAGCGPGRVTIPLARSVGPQGEVVAIDVQPRMLQRAQARARAAGATNIRFEQLAVGEGKLGTSEYDRVLLVTVLGEIPDRRSALQEIYLALKPQGILSITEIIFDPHFQSRRAILRLIDGIGFQEQAFFGNQFAFTLHLAKTERG